LKEYDQAINFQEKATNSYAEHSRYRLSSTAHDQLTYRRELAFYYRELAHLEWLKAMSSYVESRNSGQARLFAARATAHLTKSILLNPYHEAYAYRGEIAALSCKPKGARDDIQYAIELATRSGDKEAVEKYALIDPNKCWWGEKDK
jgi:hypothetical protein